MNVLTSNISNYLCLCQKRPLSSSELKNHLILPGPHKITQMKKRYIKVQNKKKYQNQIKSDSQIELDYSKKYTLKALFLLLSSIMMRSSFKIQELIVLIYMIIETDNRIQQHFNLFVQNNSIINSPNIISKIKNLYEKLTIKEVSNFKYLKASIKYSFKYFLKQASNSIIRLTLSPDNKLLITGDHSGYIRLWCANTLKFIHLFNFHSSQVHSLEVDPDSKFLLSGGIDSKICLWNLKDLKLEKCFLSHKDSVTSLKFFKCSKYFLSGSYDKIFKVWKTFTNELIYSSNFNSPIICSCFIDYQNSVLAVGISGFAMKINLRTMQKLAVTRLPDNPRCCAWYSKEDLIFIGNQNGTVQILTVQNFNINKTFTAHSYMINSIDINNYNQILITSSIDGSIEIWKLPSLDKWKSIKGLSESVADVICRTGKIFASSGSKIYEFSSFNVDLEKISDNK